MKEEKPKLVLNKKTIARLNNLEMRHVVGGDGELSQGNCSETGNGGSDTKTTQDVPTIVQSLSNLLLTKILC